MLPDDLIRTPWAALSPEAQAITRAVLADGDDMAALAARLGCGRWEATSRYLAAKLALRLRPADDRPGGDDFVHAFRRLPDEVRVVAFDVLIADRTLVEAAAAAGIGPTEAFHRFGRAVDLLTRWLPGLRS